MEVNIKIAVNEFMVCDYFFLYDLKYNYVKW